MKAGFVLVGLAILSSLAITPLPAAQLLSESFESYRTDNQGPLDANLPADVNSAPNGGPGNAWWGPAAPNLHVVGAEGLVTPHSGTNMVRGVAPSGNPQTDFELYNIAYRLHGSNVFTGNFTLDWWFYDQVGVTNGDQFEDYASLVYFDLVPTNADYNAPSGTISPPVEDFQQTQFHIMSLGAADSQGDGFDSTVYQAQLLGATNGAYDATGGWFNTTNSRSIGWHRGRITVSPVGAGGRINVAFYVDDMLHPGLTNSTTLTNSLASAPGFNCIQLFADIGNFSAYYDDVSFFDTVLTTNRATLNIAPAGTNVVLTFPSSWVLQSATNLPATNWVDLPAAASPYTNHVSGQQQYFRLRSF